MISVLLAEVSTLVAVVFFSGIVLGMLLYRVLWHVDTADLRAEIGALHIINSSLQTEIVRISTEFQRMHDQVVGLEQAGRAVQADLHAALRR